MRFMYVANARFPTEKAHGYQIVKMCEALSRQGIEVELVVPKRYNSITTSVFDYYKVSRTFTVTYVPCLDLIRYDKFFRSFALWFTAFTFFILARLYAWRKRPDVVYSRDEYCGIFFKDIILELHYLPRRKGIFHFALSRARQIILLTSHMRQVLIDRAVKSEKMMVAADAVDLNEFVIHEDKKSIRERLGLPLDRTIVLYAGSFFLYPWKGVDVLLGALSHLAKGKYFGILVGGEQQEVAQMQKQTDSERVFILSKIPRDQLVSYLKAADFLVVPNKSGDKASTHYTSPLKVFEYMTTGNVIVASDIPSIREVLNEKNALLFEANNSEDLAAKIDSLPVHSEMYNQLSQQAVTDVLQYTWEKRAANIIHFISDYDSHTNKK